MFDSTKKDLLDLLKDISAGHLQLPEFQRDWVWEDAGIRSLLASITRGFPIGSILTLDSDASIKFKPRALEGAPNTGKEPDELLLDGQQRLTSLFQSLFIDKPVKAKNDKRQIVERYYYVDIRKAVSPSVGGDEFIVGVPADRIIRGGHFARETELDLSTPEGEFEHHMFPLNKTFDEKDWIYGWRYFWGNDPEGLELEKKFDRNVLDRIKRYKVPLIRLDKTNTREAVCLVFEKVNTGGKKLDAFELLTAIYAAVDGEFRLREDWAKRFHALTHRQDVFADIQSTDFLQACTIRHTFEQRRAAIESGVTGRDLPPVICTREALLALPLDSYKLYGDPIEQGFHEAGRFLNEQKVIWRKDVPYPPQMVALAATFSVLGRRGHSGDAKAKLSRWFWCGVLGELYGSATETRIARDTWELVAWIADGGPVPTTIQDAYFQIDRFDSLRIRISAAYKGLHALIMRSCCQDFISARPVDIMTFHQDQMDIHHIFPVAWRKTNGIDPKVYNSIVNKTPLSAASNKILGGSAPSAYLSKIEKQHSSDTDLDEVLESHLIEPGLLRSDDFQAFYQARKRALARLVAEAMGKEVVGDIEAAEPLADAEDGEDVVDLLELERA